MLQVNVNWTYRQKRPFGHQSTKDLYCNVCTSVFVWRVCTGVQLFQHCVNQCNKGGAELEECPTTEEKATRCDGNAVIPREHGMSPTGVKKKPGWLPHSSMFLSHSVSLLNTQLRFLPSCHSLFPRSCVLFPDS
uniref:Uncharacterized protein n=2 Tax=Nothobranchius TaxID=28779 RepID=A0A1A7ZR58_NOTFU